MTNSADLASCESADIQRRILELIEGAVLPLRFRDTLLPMAMPWAPFWVWAFRS